MNNLEFSAFFDATTEAFRVVVQNRTNQTVCAARVEVHMGIGNQVLELGPTIRVDLAPGETLNAVLSAGGVGFDTWTLHPESSPCAG